MAKEELCRVCLKRWSPPNILVPLVHDDKLTDYGVAVLAFANVKITPNDGFPDKICAKCICQLKQAITFKFTCELSHHRLLDLKEKFAENMMGNCVQKFYSVQAQNESHFENDMPCGDQPSGLSSRIVELTAVDQPPVETRTKKKKRSKDKKAKCDICNKMFSSSGAVKNHVRRMHDDSFCIICELCGRSFKAKTDLERHLSISHGYPKKFSCKLCDYSASSKPQMRTHLARHYNVREFKCEDCGKEFYSRQTYRLHRLYHGEKKFMCDKCPKAFYRASDLAEHVTNYHNRKYLYKCSITGCKTVFKKPGTVRYHLTRVHGLARSDQGKIARVPLHKVITPMKHARLRANTVEIINDDMMELVQN